MSSRAYWRVTDMQSAISEIRKLLEGKSVNSLMSDAATRAAFERFLEILSEASRHIPDDLKEEFSEIPWRQVADLGNFIRHVYHKVDMEVLWSIYENDLDPLENVVHKLIERLRPR
jgi:uncharacterized protein with HEPN domain